MVVGQFCVCNRCGVLFEMKVSHLDQKKPHCIACTRSKKDKVGVEEVDAILKNLNALLGEK